MFFFYLLIYIYIFMEIVFFLSKGKWFWFEQVFQLLQMPKYRQNIIQKKLNVTQVKKWDVIYLKHSHQECQYAIKYSI